MVKWVVVVLVIVAVLYFVGYPVYIKHQQTLQADSGEVTCVGCDPPDVHARFLKQNSGDTADGDTPSSTTPAAAAPAAMPRTGASTMVVPGDQAITYPPPGANAPVIVPTTVQPGAMPAGMPARDSEPPNAPNDMRFAGSGTYQWYRQGNLTWRIDTTTGRSCIIYATMEEWRKQIVMSHGCGRTA